LVKPVTYLEYNCHMLTDVPILDVFGQELVEIEGRGHGGCKNEYQCHTSEGAHKLMKPVTYLAFTIHTLANAP
jgi:hypothetical protein